MQLNPPRWRQSLTVSTAILEVEFCDRCVYRYFGISKEVHFALLLAASKGSYFNRNIRCRFACTRLSNAQESETVLGSLS